MNKVKELTLYDYSEVNKAEELMQTLIFQKLVSDSFGKNFSLGNIDYMNH